MSDGKQFRFRWQDALSVIGVLLAIAGMTDMPIILRLFCFSASAVCLCMSVFSQGWPRIWTWSVSALFVVFMLTVALNAWKSSRPKSDVFIEWRQPAPMAFGTSLSEKQLNAIAKSNGTEVPGEYIYTPTFGSTLPAGIDTLTVQFTPSNLSRFNSGRESVVVLVKDAPLPTTAAVAPRNGRATAESKGRHDIQQHGNSNQGNQVTIHGNQQTSGFGSPIINGNGNTTIATH